MTHSSDQTPGFIDQLVATGKLDEPDTYSALDDSVGHLGDEPSALEQDGRAKVENGVAAKGRFSPELRRALVDLMRTGVVLAGAKPQVFELLCRHQAEIEDYLAEMFLRILIDQSAGVALLLQNQEQDGPDEDEGESSALIIRRTLSLYDTLLLLVLRKHYQERQTAGEQQIIIDSERIEAMLTPFLPLTNSSRSEGRKLSGAITKMKEKKLLSPVRGEENRWEITPVIRYVVNAEFLERMLAEYQTLAGEAGSGLEGEQDDV